MHQWVTRLQLAYFSFIGSDGQAKELPSFYWSKKHDQTIFYATYHVIVLFDGDDSVVSSLCVDFKTATSIKHQ